MNRTSHHHRGEVLRQVIATANDRRDGQLPLDVDGVAETFESELALVGALQLKWHTRLTGHIERQLVSQPLDLDAAVVAAWCGVAEELPGVRAVIDRYRDEPIDEAMATAMAKATAKEHAFLATMAGLSSVGDLSAAPLGAELERRAREVDAAVPSLCPSGVEPDDEPAVRPGVFERLRAAFAA